MDTRSTSSLSVDVRSGRGILRLVFRTARQRAAVGWRIAKTDLVVAAVCGAAAVVILQTRFAADPKSFDAIALATVGALLGAAGSAAYRAATTGEQYKQGAYTERAKAVQLVLRHARSLKARWLEFLVGRITTARAPESRALDDEAEPPGGVLDALAHDLLATTWDNRVWIGPAGEQAVRAYIERLRDIHEDRTTLSIPKERTRIEALVNAASHDLESKLMSDLGYVPN